MSIVKPVLYLTAGAPRSGKSTWAASMHGTEVVSENEIREAYGLGFDKKDMEQIYTEMDRRVRHHIKNGRSCVYDASLTSLKQRRAIFKWAEGLGAAVCVAVFHKPLETLLKRASSTPNKVISGLYHTMKPPVIGVDCHAEFLVTDSEYSPFIYEDARMIEFDSLAEFSDMFLGEYKKEIRKTSDNFAISQKADKKIRTAPTYHEKAIACFSPLGRENGYSDIGSLYAYRAHKEGIAWATKEVYQAIMFTSMLDKDALPKSAKEKYNISDRTERFILEFVSN